MVIEVKFISTRICVKLEIAFKNNATGFLKSAILEFISPEYFFMDGKICLDLHGTYVFKKDTCFS